MNLPENCKGCGKCCMLLSKKIIPVFEYHTGDNRLEILNILYGRCEYLDDNNECKIYETRPQCCKNLTKESMQCLDFLKIYEENI